jgi:hypothetical protein
MRPGRLPGHMIWIRKRESGFLQVERGEVIRKVYIKGGDIVFAYSNQETEHLGAILVKEKKITRGQLLDVMDEMEETKERMGRILVSFPLKKACFSLTRCRPCRQRN